MKKILFILLFSNFLLLSAQENYTPPQKTVQSFFKAFHEQDTTAIRKLMFENIQLTSVKTDKNGGSKISTEDFSEFLKSLKNIPADIVFEERLLAFKINIDGNLANIWTPYEFYVNEKLSHCGANNFQLIKTENTWKILSIIDTRRKRDC